MKKLTVTFGEIIQDYKKQSAVQWEQKYKARTLEQSLAQAVREYNKEVVVKTLGEVEKIDDAQDEMNPGYNIGIKLQNALIKRVQKTQDDLL